MVRVAPINLANNPRTLWFDPGDLEIVKDDPVVVETARGTEYGVAAANLLEVSDEEIAALKSPLKPVLRLATPEDTEFAAEMQERSREALPVFKQMAAEAHPEMRPVSVEFLLDGDKAVFYFEAEDRIDFRELVRRLASHFKVRIDMRQIGVRDEARMVGGLGHCGQELCCKRMGGEFCPVSIRMAKEQDLSLNPQKISGLCGRLMCCLRYEYDAYKDFKSRAPKMNATIQTPAGAAKVVELDVPREIVVLKVGDEKPVKVPLADFNEPAEEGTRPTSVGEEAWEAATAESVPGYGVEALTFLTSQFTGSDKLAEKGAVRRNASSKSKRPAASEEAPSSDSRRSRRGRGSASQKAAEPVAETRKPRRRSTKIAAGEGESVMPIAAPIESEAKSSSVKAEGETRSGRRSRSRGHRVEGSRETAAAETARTDAPKRGDRAERAEGKSSKSEGKGSNRSSRTRRERKQADSASTREGSSRNVADQSSQGKPSVRPGQKSSALRGGKNQGKPAADSAASDNAKAASAERSQGEAQRHRRPRRRKPQGDSSKNQGGSQ
ncbi:MAG: hypothetical protein IKV48_06625 [Eggerthellaceae bacterium]|nr:hypothetical protein [Eggerthellaceae bacterium]